MEALLREAWASYDLATGAVVRRDNMQNTKSEFAAGGLR